MANKKVNELPANPAIAGTQLIPLADPATGLLYQVTIDDFKGVKKFPGLTDDSNFLLPAGTILEKILVDADTDIALTIGSTNGGTDIKIPTDITADEPEVILLNLPNKTARTIYINGITGNCNLTFYFNL